MLEDERTQKNEKYIWILFASLEGKERKSFGEKNEGASERNRRGGFFVFLHNTESSSFM